MCVVLATQPADQGIARILHAHLLDRVQHVLEQTLTKGAHGAKQTKGAQSAKQTTPKALVNKGNRR